MIRVGIVGCGNIGKIHCRIKRHGRSGDRGSSRYKFERREI